MSENLRVTHGVDGQRNTMSFVSLWTRITLERALERTEYTEVQHIDEVTKSQSHKVTNLCPKDHSGS